MPLFLIGGLCMYSRFNLPPRRPVMNDEPSMTQQHFAEECDVNSIMARYQKTGILVENPGTLRPFFDDFTNVSDFQTAQNAVIDVHESFMQLPSRIRARFDNDPGALLEFLGNEVNRNEAVSLGLVNPVSVGGDDGNSTQADPVSTAK